MRSIPGRKLLRWKPIAKVLLTGLAIYWVWRQIAFNEIVDWVIHVPVYLTFAAFILFNLSKIIGAIRLNHFFKSNTIDLPEIENLKLYYKGMFYNLFLPGGIGGDGYKVYYLSKIMGVSWTGVVSSIIWDRLSGAVAMVFMAMLLSAFHPSVGAVAQAHILIIGALALTYPVFYLLTVFLFPAFKSTVIPSTIPAIAIQVLQMLVAVIILSGMDISLNLMGDYLIVFLLSSFATIIPITVGGIGIREIVFITASQYTAIEEDKAVAFSLVFFAINAISAAAGAFLDSEIDGIASGPD